MRLLSFIPISAAGMAIIFSTAVLAADAETLPGSGTAKRAAASQCLNNLRAFDKMLAKTGFGVLPPAGYGASAPAGYYGWGIETPRHKIRSLREAAYVYALSDDEQSCEMILSSMQKIYEDHQKRLAGQKGDDLDTRRQWRRAHLSTAKPVAQMDHLMRADVFIGSELRNLKDEKLGEIKDLVLNPEKQDILYVLVSRGGFLGLGEKLVAVRWSDLRATEDHELYVLDAQAKALDDAPKVGRGNFEKTADADWRRSLSEYWDRVLKR